MSDLADLLNELDFESWLDHEGIRHKLTRGKSGLQANIRECPCCGNTKWKVYFGLETGAGNCFVCGEKFGKWSFIAAYLNVSNGDVFRYLKTYMQAQGWRPKTTTVVQEYKPPELIIPDSVELPHNGRNLKYLSDRHVTSGLAKFFELRYSTAGKFSFKDAYGNEAEQDYSARVIIPVRDIDGKLVNFQGRDITGHAEKKYLFPPGFASTGSVLYNAHNVIGRKRVVLGEGVFDCIAIHAALMDDPRFVSFGAIASFGKQLGFEQIERLRQLQAEGMETLTFMWDAEKEAVEAAVDAAMECKTRGINCEIALLPKDKDPNEVEPEVVRQAILKATTVTIPSAIKLKMQARRL